MKKHLIIIAAILLCSVGASAQDKDDFGTWVEIGAEKNFLRPFSLGADLELRTEDNSQKVDRWSAGVSAGYKVNKYLKLGLSYSFLDGYNRSKEKQSKQEYSTTQELVAYRLRLTPSYWKPRHRVSFDVSTGIKFWKRIRFSLRERYQYTYHAEQSIDRTDYEYELENGEWTYELRPTQPSPKIEEKSQTHVLRSRLKIEWDKKRCKWSPFVSVETQNELNQKMDLRKIRSAAGTGYKINRHHSVSAAYVFTNETEGVTERMHAINIGYNYKF